MRKIMSKWMRTGLLGIAGSALVIGMVCSPASAQVGQVLYGGRPSDVAGLIIGSWGGGVAKEVSKGTYSGMRAVEITPNWLFAGGRIDFTNPIDVTSDFNNKNAYVQIVTKFGSDTGTGAYGTGTMPGIPTMPGNMPGMPGNVMGGAMPGMMPGALGGAMPGMMPGTLGGTMPGMGGTMTGTSTTIIGRPIPNNYMQIIIQFTDGQSTACQVGTSSFDKTDDGWLTVSFPVAVLKQNLANADSYKIKRIVIGGDGTELMRIGEIRTEYDDSMLTANAGDDKEVGRNDRVSFVGSSSAGASAVTYSWDFDASDGIQDENEGPIVYHRFTKAGTYTVTLTVSDVFGIKKPATSTVTIKVND